jgi:hypothetical protein
MINASTQFVSPDQNKGALRELVNIHRQPEAAASIISKVNELPRRASVAGDGFDGLGVVMVSARNDGTPVRLINGPPAPAVGDILFYENMIARVANEYDTRFGDV